MIVPLALIGDALLRKMPISQPVAWPAATQPHTSSQNNKMGFHQPSIEVVNRVEGFRI
jgi:hypothetical protein